MYRNNNSSYCCGKHLTKYVINLQFNLLFNDNFVVNKINFEITHQLNSKSTIFSWHTDMCKANQLLNITLLFELVFMMDEHVYNDNVKVFTLA